MHFRLKILLGSPGAARSWEDAVLALTEGRAVDVQDTAASWPFRRTVTPSDTPGAIVIPALHHAFPAGQSGGTRLVLTQSTFQLQKWLDWLRANPESVVVGDLRDAPPDVRRDARAQRGPWSRLQVVQVAEEPRPASPAAYELHQAFSQPDPELRYSTCVAAAAAPGDVALTVALASACMETGRLDEAEEALANAAAVAPEWEAVHYELGKLWLRRDDTGRAALAFAEAARLMPSFAAAHANLGAALGELERPEDALSALEQAAALDPFGHAIHNNIGASLRDLGRLAEAEVSFRRVLAIAPDFVFGQYNLGHVLFLQGRFADARTAYEAGLSRDPSKTPRQRIRLALALAASGDGTAATEHARAALDDTTAGGRDELLDEVEEVLYALTALQLERRPALERLQQVVADYRPATPRS